MASLESIPKSRNTAALNPFFMLVSIKIKKAGPSIKLIIIPNKIPFWIKTIGLKIFDKKKPLKSGFNLK